MNTSSKQHQNFFAVLFAVLMGIGSFMPFISSISVFGVKLNLSVMDVRNGWVLLVLAGIGILAGISNSKVMMVLTGGAGFAAVMYGYYYISGGSSRILQFLTTALTERQLGFYVITVGAIGLMISMFFGRDQK